jgi:hypothetical protein
MSFNKATKKFVLSDSSVNEYGFRLLTSGYQLESFAKNPIGYYMHKREDGVALKWEALAIDGDTITGIPVINMSNPRGQQLVDEVENGFLNAASVGHIVVLEYSNDADMMLPGQTGPTITKWYNKECSLVDIPGNRNALTSLYDHDGNEVTLADLASGTKNVTTQNQNKTSMEGIILTADNLVALNLAASADAAAINTALGNLVSEKNRLEREIQNLKDAQTAGKVADILVRGLAARKLTVQLKEKLAQDYANNPEGLQSLLDAMPAHQSIVERIAQNPEKVAGLAAKTWDELDKEGQLASLRAHDLDTFKIKYKEKFGKELKD